MKLDYIQMIRHLLTVFIVLILIGPVISAWASNNIRLEGFIIEHKTGEPIPSAKLQIYRWQITWRSLRRWRAGWEKLPLLVTDENGYFKLNLDADSEHIIIAYYDDQDTPGFDYLPYVKKLIPSDYENFELNFSLLEGASVKVQGEAFFLESTKIPESTYDIYDPISMEILPLGEDIIQQGIGTDTINSYLGLSSNIVIIPSNKSLLL
jgi:hypothetical protein